MTDAAIEVPTPPKPGVWEDFIDIFYHPSQVFERRREGQFGIALVAFVIVSAVLFFLLRNGLAPIFDAEMSKSAAAMAQKNPQISAEQLAASQGFMEKFMGIGFVIGLPIAIIISGLLLWIIGKIVGASAAIAATMMVVTYSQFPRIVEMVTKALQGLFLPPEAITSRYSVQIGPARFLGTDANPVLATVLGGLDLYSIWVAVLMTIGLSIVARVPRSRAAIAAGLVWFCSLIPGLIQAM